MHKIIKHYLNSCKARNVIFTASVLGFLMLGLIVACLADGPYKLPRMVLCYGCPNLPLQEWHFVRKATLGNMAFLSFPPISDRSIHFSSSNACISMTSQRWGVVPQSLIFFFSSWLFLAIVEALVQIYIQCICQKNWIFCVWRRKWNIFISCMRTLALLKSVQASEDLCPGQSLKKLP